MTNKVTDREIKKILGPTCKKIKRDGENITIIFDLSKSKFKTKLPRGSKELGVMKVTDEFFLTLKK